MVVDATVGLLDATSIGVFDVPISVMPMLALMPDDSEPPLTLALMPVDGEPPLTLALMPVDGDAPSAGAPHTCSGKSAIVIVPKFCPTKSAREHDVWIETVCVMLLFPPAHVTAHVV